MNIPIKRHQLLWNIEYLVRHSLVTCNALLAIVVMAIVGTAVSCYRNGVDFPNVKVQFIDSQNGWIVGPRLWKTNNGGDTWKEVRSQGNGTIKSQVLFTDRQIVQFVNPEVGWMMTDRGIIKTTDGGQTWQNAAPIPLNEQEVRPLSIFFISPQEGWTVGENIYHTNNAGQDWAKLS
jgi:photosystem II stability/assembly factor-like uncharacterized protein